MNKAREPHQKAGVKTPPLTCFCRRRLHAAVLLCGLVACGVQDNTAFKNPTVPEGSTAPQLIKDIINTNADRLGDPAPEEQVRMRMMKMLWTMSGCLFLGGGARRHLGCGRGRGFLEETPTHRRI